MVDRDPLSAGRLPGAFRRFDHWVVVRHLRFRARARGGPAVISLSRSGGLQEGRMEPSAHETVFFQKGTAAKAAAYFDPGWRSTPTIAHERIPG